MSGIWGHVVGQDAVVARLEAAAESPSHAYLFIGSKGVGTRDAARAFAAALLCRERGCGECRDCRLALADEHPDVTVVERVGASISAGQAREVVRLAALTPAEGLRNVLVLDEFHLIAPEAAGILLKTIEEPPASTVFIVLAESVPPELVTIASRCVRIDFRPLSDDAISAALHREGIEPDLAHEVARAAQGDLQRARLLAGDPELAARRHAFERLPKRLDGTGAAVCTAVEELLGLINGAAGPLKARQAREVAELEARVEQMGERGAGRKALVDRHKRELRRHRTDELRYGLGTVAATYRDELVAGTARDPRAAVTAIESIHEALEALERNPNEHLLLQALLLRLPPA